MSTGVVSFRKLDREWKKIWNHSAMLVRLDDLLSKSLKAIADAQSRTVIIDFTNLRQDQNFLK